MKTKRIRIAVAMTASGAWNSAGWSTSTAKNEVVELEDDDKSGYAREPLDEDAIVHWVEAEIPVPEATTVQGEVTPT